MRLVLNGQEHDIGSVATVADLLRSLQVTPQLVAVERNGELVSRNRYDATPLAEGDRLEIVTLVGGG